MVWHNGGHGTGEGSVGVMQDREAASKGNWEVESVNVLNMLLLC